MPKPAAQLPGQIRIVFIDRIAPRRRYARARSRASAAASQRCSAAATTGLELGLAFDQRGNLVTGERVGRTVGETGGEVAPLGGVAARGASPRSADFAAWRNGASSARRAAPRWRSARFLQFVFALAIGAGPSLARPASRLLV